MNENNFIKNIHKCDLKLMNICIEVAKKSNMNSKHGCIIIDSNNKIVSSAYNKRTSMHNEHIHDPIIRLKKKFSTHAEENALKNVNRNKLKGAKLYVVRWGCNDEQSYFMNSKPCSKCTAIIQACFKFGLKAAYYSTDSNDFLEI